MKIGILTFHEADSYGAVLQAYALQQTLRRLGADSEFVQIRQPSPTSPEPPMSGAAAIFARRLKAEGQKREQLFAAFRREYLEISPDFQPSDPICDAYDRFLAGSDQIWNFRIPGADSRYFLPFAKPEQCYSYAASFGTEALPEKAEVWVSRQLSRFQAISVREESGCKIVKSLTGRDVPVCLDPTLLPDPQEWEAMAPVQEAPCVLLFLLKYDEQLASLAKAEAERQGVPLRVVTAAFMPQMGIPAWNTTGVTDWLGAIRNARCVFTNSFHGMVFSLIFRRPFRICKLTGELGSRNGRLEELLSCLALSDALEMVVQPDYDRVWKLLKPRREASMNYLRRIISHDTVI